MFLPAANAPNLTFSRSSISAETVAGVVQVRETVSLTAPETSPWSASTNVPWITLAATSGSTPGELTALLSATPLAAGNYQGTITITSGGSSSGIPVSLRVYAANYMLAKADQSDGGGVFRKSRNLNTVRSSVSI